MFLLVKLKLSIQKLSRHHDLVNRYWMFFRLSSSVHNPVLSSFLTDHQIFNKINTMSVTSGAATAYTSRAPEFSPVY